MKKRMESRLQDFCKAMMWVINIAEARLNNRRTPKRGFGIGLVRLDAIGDFVLWTDTIRAFRNLFPDQHFCLFCNSACADLAKTFEEFDEIVPIDMKQYKRLSQLRCHKQIRKQLQQYKMDILIHSTYSRGVYAESIAAAIPANEKIAVAGDAANCSKWVKRINDHIYDRLVEIPSDAVMEMERNKYFIRELGAKNFQSGYGNFLQMSASFCIQNKYFILYLGGSNPSKYWPIERWVKASEYVYQKYHWKCCLIGIDEQLRQCFYKEKQIPEDDVIDLVGKTTLVEVAGLIAHSQLLLGNDTSGVHFAVACHVPSVTVAGGWEFGRFLPYVSDNPIVKEIQKTVYCNMFCFYCETKKKTVDCQMAESQGKPYRCIANVTVEQVIQKIDEIGFLDEQNEYID